MVISVEGASRAAAGFSPRLVPPAPTQTQTVESESAEGLANPRPSHVGNAGDRLGQRVTLDGRWPRRAPLLARRAAAGGGGALSVSTCAESRSAARMRLDTRWWLAERVDRREHGGQIGAIPVAAAASTACSRGRRRRSGPRAGVLDGRGAERRYVLDVLRPDVHAVRQHDQLARAPLQLDVARHRSWPGRRSSTSRRARAPQRSARVTPVARMTFRTVHLQPALAPSSAPGPVDGSDRRRAASRWRASTHHRASTPGAVALHHVDAEPFPRSAASRWARRAGRPAGAAGHRSGGAP